MKMWLRIVEITGNNSIEEAQENISLEEYFIWCHHYRKEPWGYHMENLRADILNNIVRGIGGKNTRPILIDKDFVKLSNQTNKEKEQEMIGFIQGMAAHGK